MRQILLALGVFMQTVVMAQVSEDLVVFYSFDNNVLVDELSNSAAQIVGAGTNNFPCGVQGSAFELTGAVGGGVLIYGSAINNIFRISDFTLSFYFKPLAASGTLDLISKRSACNSDSALIIKYNVSSRTILCQISENENKSMSIQHKLDKSDCWHLITLVRDHTKLILYVNGQFAAQTSLLSVINLSNIAPLTLSNGPCNDNANKPFKGHIDELRIYDRALEPDEVKTLFFNPDKIMNRDTVIYLTDVITTAIYPSCAQNFQWSPTTGIFNTTSPITNITAVQPGIFDYVLSFDDGACIAYDTLRVTVIDPATLDCREIYLPNAFTPNGDPINPVFKISNPAAIPELIGFSIFDRWGTRVFHTTDKYDGWDGTFMDQNLDPGVFLYTLEWQCQGERLFKNGPVTLIR